jgi:hypothetical protein
MRNLGKCTFKPFIPLEDSRTAIKISIGKPVERDHYESLGVNGRTSISKKLGICVMN